MPLTSQHQLSRQRTHQDDAMRQLFPLPLSPFELFMLFDDRPNLPMTFCVELAFSGRFERDVLQAALNVAVWRHPLLRSLVEWQRRNPVWILPEFDSQPLSWLGEEQRQQSDLITSLDLARNPGLRVFAVEGDQHSSLVFHFHHACCDGLGARRFVVDVLTGYARAFASSASLPDWNELDYGSLKRRHEFDSRGTKHSSAKTSLRRKLQDAFHFHFLTPRPLAKVASSPIGSTHVTPIQRHVFNAADSNRIQQLAHDRGTSLNDVALALLFQTLAKWNREYGSADSDRRLRIMMPMDLRSIRDRRMPAANRMSFSFLARTVREIDSWESLLTGIRHESQYIQQVRIGLDFLAGISLAQKLPGLLPLLMRRPSCLATAVLTNSGDTSKRFRRWFPRNGNSVLIGNLILDHVFGTPPIRPHIHAGFGVSVCSRQICLSMLGNAQALGENGGGLLQKYVDNWRSWSERS